MLRWALVLILGFNFSCVTPERDLTKAPKPLAPAIDLGEQPLQQIILMTPVQPEPLPVKSSSNCRSLPEGVKLPFYIKSLSVVLIGFLKTCIAADGREGYETTSSWTALGFPCSGGKGRIDKKGSDGVPGLVSFHLANSCLMQPASAQEIEKQVQAQLGISADAKLIAYYPLSVDYWEFSDFPEHDVGAKPELFAQDSLVQGWQKFATKAEPLRIRLYGRENAWQPAKKIYKVEANILPENRSHFRLQVLSAKVLDDENRSQLSERCKALRPKRACDEVFAGSL